MAGPIRVVHYLNQFFAGRGGEEAAGEAVSFVEGPLGPGRLLQQRLGETGRIAGTVVGGDAYVAERPEAARAAFVALLHTQGPDVVLAGPAFESGRYGVACIQMLVAASDRGVPAAAAMHPANPALALRRPGGYVVPTAADATGMMEAISRLAVIGVKLGRREPLGPAVVDGYLPTGERRPVVHPEPGHTRAMAMLVDKLAGRSFRSELALLRRRAITPAPPLDDTAKSRLALNTSGGLVPRGNPDRMPHRYSRHWETLPR
jgi:glycine reductase complex component B subunit gamma